MKPIDQDLWTARVAMACQVELDEGTLTDVARLWGTSLPYVVQTLESRNPDLRKRIVGNSRQGKRALSREEVIRRLQIVHAEGSLSKAAAKVGLTYWALAKTVRDYAPDGVEESLSCYGVAA